MKFRRCVGVLLGLSMLFAATPTALAEPTPSPSASPLSELEQYKLALAQFRIEMNLRVQLRKEIAKAFISSVKEADSLSKSAMRTAKNDRERTLIRDQRETAIAEAMKIRDEAIEAMGVAPVEPVKPVKPVIATTGKKTKSSKPSPTPSP
ncbi:MAG: hypothetical protein Q7R42_08015 [Candidatus Planktophila sp.]|nr:hypothetical protein [Candidatus Planktophila sp.]